MSVIPIIGKTQSADSWTPKQMLEDAISDIENKTDQVAAKAKKAFVVFLDDSDGQYATNFYNAGMSHSQIVALIEAMKIQLLRGMGF